MVRYSWRFGKSYNGDLEVWGELKLRGQFEV